MSQMSSVSGGQESSTASKAAVHVMHVLPNHVFRVSQIHETEQNLDYSSPLLSWVRRGFL